MALRRRRGHTQPSDTAPRRAVIERAPAISIPEGDPLEALLLDTALPVELHDVQFESPAVAALRDAGIDLVVPLVGHGELLGALYLGPRLSDQPYSSEDRKLLANLASQVAPAMQVARLVQEQQAEAKERERVQQEMKVAAVIQQTLLPRELPSVPGWQVEAFYRPARAVGGDFYDFVSLSDGRLGIVIGDVTDKGVPAALVMATCRSMLRTTAVQHDDPGQVLAAVNDALVSEIPPAMFVTCLYAIVDTDSGELVFANAGHNLPYVRTEAGVAELRATGMPLGLMQEMKYETVTHRFKAGEVMVLTSDGITEAHGPDGEMYGFERLAARVEDSGQDPDVVSAVIEDLERYCGPGAEQEDDITLVVLHHTATARDSARAFAEAANDAIETLDAFSVASEPGNERTAMDRVAATVAALGLDPRQLDRLKTAVSEAVMNAIEHGNRADPGLTVDVAVLAGPTSVTVRVTDQGGEQITETPVPDLEAKLAGDQSPRGWGLFLIGHMVDDFRDTANGRNHTLELVFNQEGGR